MAIRLWKQEDRYGIWWLLDGVSKATGKELSGNGWEWVRGIGGPGCWATADEEKGRRAEELFGVTPYPWKENADARKAGKDGGD